MRQNVWLLVRVLLVSSIIVSVLLTFVNTVVFQNFETIRPEEEWHLQEV